MTKYCEHCSLTFEGEGCPRCGRKSAREAAPDDICFLTEKEQIWSGMLADVLKQHGIPFVQKNVLGTGMTLRTGPMFESVRFYVFYQHLAEATEIVEALFSSPGGEG